MAFSESESGQESWQELDLEKCELWKMHGGEWTADAEGMMTSPAGNADENVAIFNAGCFVDFEAEFQFRWNNYCCGGGLLFRGSDLRHYYLVELPCTGQQYRAEYFWAAICKVDDRGWTEVLHTEWLSGAPSEIGWWHRIRLRVLGDEFRLFVNGRPFPVVHDAAYRGPGHIGLYAYDGIGNFAACSFRNLRLRGRESDPCWDGKVPAVRNWYYPTTEETYGPVLMHRGFTPTPGGDLLMQLSAKEEFHTPAETGVSIRSNDGGRTWSAMEKLPPELAQGHPHTTRDGRLCQFHLANQFPFDLSLNVSTDDGRTWNGWEACGRVQFPDDVDVVVPNHLLELRDGTLVWFLYRHTNEPSREKGPKEGIEYWSFCIRSTDGGRSWSEPIDLDGPKPEGFERYWMISKHFGSETCGAQTRDGRLVSFIRPLYEPVMWETWSEDGGQTWTPIHRGPFGNWACTSAMLTTASGVLFLAGRHPGLAAQISYDDGMTWTCYRFDTTFWANGMAVEIEPDLVMFVSTAKYSDPRPRVFLFRITPEGPVPERLT